MKNFEKLLKKYGLVSVVRNKKRTLREINTQIDFFCLEEIKDYQISGPDDVGYKKEIKELWKVKEYIKDNW